MSNVNILTDNNTVIVPDNNSLDLILAGGLVVKNGNENTSVINDSGMISVDNISGLTDYLTKFGEDHNYISYDYEGEGGGGEGESTEISLIINGGNSR